MEGVMILGRDKACMACRRRDGSISMMEKDRSAFHKKHGWARLPFVRGCVNLVLQLKMGYSMLMQSANFVEADELEGEQPAEAEASKATQGQPETQPAPGDEKKKGESGLLVYASTILGIVLAIGLFFVLPSFLAGGVLPQSSPYISLLEGGIRILILVAYMLACSLMKDMRRVFQYHGAEHKVIHCYEHEVEPMPENAANFSRVHPSCGTSYLFLVMIISILVFSFIGQGAAPLVRVGLRIALLPLVAGISYEVLKLAARSENILAKIVRAPGLLLQLITTKEPDDDMIEVAAKAFYAALDEG